jgi:uncharacterized membrane protein YqiK
MIMLAKWYRRPGSNEALVRTGKDGRKIVIDGGIFEIPILHKILPVSLETMKLQISRVGKEAFTTADGLRVDIEAEFYIRVEAREADILRASRTLGERSLSPQILKELVEGKLVGALRIVLAAWTWQDMDEKRQEFADAVQEACMEDLMSNGLTLESVSVTKLEKSASSNGEHGL